MRPAPRDAERQYATPDSRKGKEMSQQSNMKKMRRMKQRETTASLRRRPHGLFVSSDHGVGWKRHAGTDMRAHDIDAKIGRAM